MYTPDRLPIRSTPEPVPVQRHHTPRQVFRRVQESLSSRVSKLICAVFLGFLLLVGILTFVLWLSLRPHRPRFYVHEFSVPGLGQATALENVEIAFNVTVRNPNQNIGIFYDSMNGSIYYNDQQIGTKSLLFPFYQEPKNTTVVDDVITVNSHHGTKLMGDRAAGTVVFRLQITSTIRFKISTWDSKHHRAHASCDISVGRDGTILPISKNKRCPVYFT